MVHDRKLREPISMSIEKRGGEHVKSLRATPDSGSESFFKHLRAWHVDNLRQDAPSRFAACSVASTNDSDAVGSAKTAIRCTFGTASTRISRRFELTSVLRKDSPVRLPPGRKRLVTIPEASASPSAANTMGILAVASAAARTGAVPAVTITSTLRCASSAARC